METSADASGRLNLVASIWATYTDSRSAIFLAAHASTPAAQALASYSVAALTRTAGMTARRRRGRTLELPLEDWLDALRKSDREHDEAKREAQRIADLISRAESSTFRVPGAASEDVREAVTRLRRRNADVGALASRRPRPARWRSAPSPRDPFVPIIAADAPELAIVAILSATIGEWQFSKSAASNGGRMFTHEGHGWARDDGSRTYVAGLSDVIDTVSGLLESHRGPAGGRVHLTDSIVRCADCRRVIASIENKYTREAKTVGICPAVRARQRTSRRTRP